MFLKDNDYSRRGYLLRLLYYELLGGICFRILIYQPIPGRSGLFSKCLLWGMIAVFMLVGLAFSIRYARNYISLIFIVIAPYTVYTVLICRDTFPMLTLVLMVLTVVFTSLRIYILHRRYEKIQEHLVKDLPLRWKLSKYFGSAYCVITCVMGSLTLYLIALGGISWIKNEVIEKQETYENREPVTIFGNIETISKLDEDVFATLNREEKLEVFKAVVDIEEYYLGIPYDLKVEIRKLEDHIAAWYEPKERKIVFNLVYFDTRTAHELLGDCTHEVRHAYQACLCECYQDMNSKYKGLQPFQDVPEYIEELKNYTNDGSLEYYSQLIEIDSRHYSSDAVEDYYRKIELYR
ncbi:MAG: hypothetical protein K6E85_07750 [Lachnospiraceae bacterium]|nr:hypothetical protein [Lachnospiraceae bacterium]